MYPQLREHEYEVIDRKKSARAAPISNNQANGIVFMGKASKDQHSMEKPGAVSDGTTAPLSERGEFKVFPKLPLELRNMVWKEAARVPQLVKIGLNPSAHRYIGEVVNFTKPPALLHVCTESRRVALPEYEVAFAKWSTGDGIYFNFERDAISFDFKDGYVALTYFFNPSSGIYGVHSRIAFPPGRKLLALSIQDMASESRLNARSLRLLGEPSHVILVRKSERDAGMDAQNAAWIEEFWTCGNGHINVQGELYPCPQVLALTYEQLQTKLDKLST
ncbi:hypothetical protein BKA65DRAFT_423996 [Rhexocercosporidium sp. MPI-PUGE-AT-0058]|nr:hypothetical protein BKA65DRAFT_423996 [Rhexocercosporidium sp. MPI-PUGE-AT-0058]